MLQPYPQPADRRGRLCAGRGRHRVAEGDGLALRRIRSELGVSPGKQVRCWFAAAMPTMPRASPASTRNCASCAASTASKRWPASRRPAAAARGRLKLFVPLEGLVDLDAERARLDKEIAKVAAEKDKSEAKLAKFGAGVPLAVVEQERARLVDWSAKLEALTALHAQTAVGATGRSPLRRVHSSSNSSAITIASSRPCSRRWVIAAGGDRSVKAPPVVQRHRARVRRSHLEEHPCAAAARDPAATRAAVPAMAVPLGFRRHAQVEHVRLARRCRARRSRAVRPRFQHPHRVPGLQAVAEDAARPREGIGACLDRDHRVEVAIAHRPQRGGRRGFVPADRAHRPQRAAWRAAARSRSASTARASAGSRSASRSSGGNASVPAARIEGSGAGTAARIDRGPWAAAARWHRPRRAHGVAGSIGATGSPATHRSAHRDTGGGRVRPMPRAGTDPSSCRPAHGERRRHKPLRRPRQRIQHRGGEQAPCGGSSTSAMITASATTIAKNGTRSASARCRHPEAGEADAADHQQAGGDGHAERDMAQFAPGPAQVVRGPDEARHQTGGGRTREADEPALVDGADLAVGSAPAAAPRRPRTGTRRASRALPG